MSEACGHQHPRSKCLKHVVISPASKVKFKFFNPVNVLVHIFSFTSCYCLLQQCSIILSLIILSNTLVYLRIMEAEINIKMYITFHNVLQVLHLISHSLRNCNNHIAALHEILYKKFDSSFTRNEVVNSKL